MKNKIIKFIFDWIVYILIGVLVIFYLIYFEELFFQIKNNFLRITSIIILTYSFLNAILDGFTASSIEENQWENFKRGLDYYIDKMVDSIIMRSKVLFLLMLFWIGFFIYILFKNHNEINVYKFLFVFLTPVIINSFLIKNTLNIRNDYEK
jgi:hypothetical protein